MKFFLHSLVVACLLSGCATKSGTPHPIGPFYYMSAPSKAGDYRPPGDLSEKEAQEAASRGFPVYVAYFDSKGKPDKILKVSGGETEVLKE